MNQLYVTVKLKPELKICCPEQEQAVKAGSQEIMRAFYPPMLMKGGDECTFCGYQLEDQMALNIVNEDFSLLVDWVDIDEGSLSGDPA